MPLVDRTPVLTSDRMNGHLLKVLQRRIARGATGASAARGRGNAGVVDRARAFTSDLRLDRLAINDSQVHRRRLDAATDRLRGQLPRRGASWGFARKLLIIFIRDCVYVGYFRSARGLEQIWAFCEVPRFLNGPSDQEGCA